VGNWQVVVVQPDHTSQSLRVSGGLPGWPPDHQCKIGSANSMRNMISVTASAAGGDQQCPFAAEDDQRSCISTVTLLLSLGASPGFIGALKACWILFRCVIRRLGDRKFCCVS
jgi:hypothetical protein